MSSQKRDDSNKRGRGRPPTYVFSGDEELSESMEKLKLAIERRRKSQKTKYHQSKLKDDSESNESHKEAEQQPGASENVQDGGLIIDIALSGNSVSESSPDHQKDAWRSEV